MADYIEKEAAKEAILSWAVCINHPELLSKEDAMHCIDNLPAADVVPKAAYDQVAWERDLAVKQLHEDYGVGLGGKKADTVKVVRCKNCRYYQTAKSNKKGFLICPASGMEITETDYCSYGARMDKEDDHDKHPSDPL